MADLASAVARAKQAGYSDAEIAAHIAADPAMGPKVAQARKAGYSDAEIVSHLGTTPQQGRANADAQKRAASVPGQVRAVDNGFAFNAMGAIDGAGAAAETGIHNLVSHLTGQPDSGYGMKEAFHAVRGAEAEASNDFARKHPVQNLAANVVGAMANPVNRAAGAYTAGAGSLGSAVIRSGTTGAAIGAAYGAGGTQPGQSVTRNALKGAAIGGATGAASPVVAKVAGKVANALSNKRPDTEAVVNALKGQKTDAYQTVRDMGAAYKPEAASDLAAGIQDELKAANISSTRHPKAFSMMSDIADRLNGGKPVSLDDLDLLRQEVRRDVSNPRNDQAEQFFGDKIIRNIDEFVDSAGPDQMVNGDAAGAAQAIKRARELNTRYRKVDSVSRATESAELRADSTGSGGNVNNATRQKLRPLIDPQSSKRIRNLTPEEEDLLNKAVRGTTVGNAARQVGKLSPEGNGLTFMLHAGGALASHGSTLPVAVAGFVGKRIADAETAKSVQRLILTMAQGGARSEEATQQLTSLAARNPAVSQLYRDLMGAAPAVAASGATAH